MKCFKDKNKKSSLLKILVFVSLLIKSAQGLKVTNLSPGVHIYPIGTCEVKATELVLTINTTLSIDSDKEVNKIKFWINREFLKVKSLKI